jgi:hypothetical protein
MFLPRGFLRRERWPCWEAVWLLDDATGICSPSCRSAGDNKLEKRGRVKFK